MAERPTITIKIKVSCSMWDALKLRISGAGAALKETIKKNLNEKKENNQHEAI